jgi:hypothetical protein
VGVHSGEEGTGTGSRVGSAMRFGYIMGGCVEELTDEEWKWLTLMLPPTEIQNRSPRS